MEDDLNFLNIQDNLNFFTMEDDLNFSKMEDDLIFFNGRRTYSFKNESQTQKPDQQNIQKYNGTIKKNQPLLAVK